MNYPIWEIPKLGGGLLIALIAILHVYISHLAVGGGLFIWLTDRKAIKEQDQAILAYVKKHTNFFLLLTMVFGGMTGVGIWFIISLVHPAATSTLIHNFVFAWAIEWVFFVGEIVALLVYYYRFDRLSSQNRLRLAFLYFLFAWLSLVVINGILTFMLTPGKWLETGNFWHGFLNPTYFPGILFRSCAATMIAGLFAYVTIVFREHGTFRTKMLRYASRWLFFSLPGLIVGGFWYIHALPESVRYNAFLLNPQTQPWTGLILGSTALIFLAAIYFSLKTPPRIQQLVTVILLLIGLTWMGSFEFLREDARKPYVIYDHMYSTSVLKSNSSEIEKEGFLASARWVSEKEVTSNNLLSAGKELFRAQCLICHTVNGLRNDILSRTKDFTAYGLYAMLHGQGKISPYMPPFHGTEEEKKALAAYVAHDLHQLPETQEKEALLTNIPSEPVPFFDRTHSQYVLLAWNTLGMKCITDCDPWFVLSPPGNTIEAQLIKRGPTPEIITEGVKIHYQIQKGHENPRDKVPFWQFAERIFHRKVAPNRGLSGNGLSGIMQLDEERYTFRADSLPVIPYADNGTFNPFPIVYVEARDSETETVLARTAVVAPVSTRMGCRICHGGPWRIPEQGGISDVTARNILRTHDRLSGTTLLKDAQNGRPRYCGECHVKSDLAAEQAGQPSALSVAMHGFHAPLFPIQDSRSCAFCHPVPPNGSPRGIHGLAGLTCIDCHGKLSEHSLALLKGRELKTKRPLLQANLERSSLELKEINGRVPWKQEPDCLTCHVDFEPPAAPGSAFNQWNDEEDELYRRRAENAGIQCAACHGSPHVIYPAKGDRHHLQALQYTQKPLPIGANLGCEVCHMQKMEDPIHHENMYREFRNTHLLGDGK